MTVTTRSSGWPGGSSRGPRGALPIAANASSSMLAKAGPPNGGSNQRARTKRASLARTSPPSALASPSSSWVSRPAAYQASGNAHSFDIRDDGAAAGSSKASISAPASHNSVNGSRLCPVATAWARKMPLIPPALAPATMSGNTRRRVSAACSNSANSLA